MFNFYSDLFCGIYLYLLKAEKGGKGEISSYFAYSSILALVFLEWLFFFSLAVLAGENIFSLYKNFSFGFSVLVFLFVFNRVLFINKMKYADLIKLYSRKSSTELLGLEKKITVLVIFVLSFFIFSLVIRLNN